MAAPVFRGGKSGHHRTGCSVTQRRREAMESATESRLPMVLFKTQAMVKRCGKSAPGSVAIWSAW
jgi:hypothetical protein